MRERGVEGGARPERLVDCAEEGGGLTEELVGLLG